MAENLTIESPAFDEIQKEAGRVTRDAIQLLWYVANNEAAERRRGVRKAQEQSIRKVKSDAPSAQQDNYDAEGAGILLFTGADAFDLTGIRNGVTGETIVLHSLGAGVVTIKHADTDSDDVNRFDTAADADVTIATGETVIVRYLDSRWRQQVQAT